MRHLDTEAASAPSARRGEEVCARCPRPSRDALWGLLAASLAAVVLALVWSAFAPDAARARPRDPAPLKASRPAIVFAQVSADAGLEKRGGTSGQGMLRDDYGKRSRIMRLEPDGTLRKLTPGFVAACEMDVSFDGKRILFAGKRRLEDAWNIFEMNADGSNVRQVTRDLGDCRSPAYQSTLYTIVSTEPWYQVMFTSTAAGDRNEGSDRPATNLYTCKLDGTSARRITFNLSSDMDPYLMEDGRILLASWQRMDLRRGERGRVSLFGVNADGVDYALFCGDEGARIKHMPCATTKGLVVFIEADRVGWDGAGHLAGVTLRRNFHSHRRILPEADGFLYHAPSPTRDGAVLVSRRRADGTSTHAIVRLDPASGAAETVYDDPNLHDMHPRVLATRPEPDGRSSSVSEKYDWSKLYCMDAYRMEPKLHGRIPPGTIRALRVIEGVPAKAGGSSAGPGPALAQRRLMGVIPVARDGSFQVELPPDVPVQLQTLDENGMALRSCGWIWAKQREPRGCIGCHEDPELTPENRFVDALKVPAPKLRLPPERRRTVDFRRDVMPILARHCVKCHRKDVSEEWANPLVLAGEGKGGVNRAYLELTKRVSENSDTAAYRYVHPGQARTSPLIWRVFGRNTSRPWDPAWQARDKAVRRMPPRATGPGLSREEKQTLVEWVDLGALWDGIPGDGDARNERERESR